MPQGIQQRFPAWHNSLYTASASMVHKRLIFVTIGLLVLNNALSEECKPRIAIIGGGIGGASASHFLTELFDEHLEIDLYEGKTIGGRLAVVEFDGKSYEAGGSIIHPQNLYMQYFVKLLGMEHAPTYSERHGIWNGDEFVFKDSSWDIVTLSKLFFRYGFQPFQLHGYVGSILNDFSKIYDLQKAGKYFANVTSMLAAMNKDFPRLMQMSIKNELTRMGYGKQIINELVQATLVVNYGQDINVQSFVGCVSLAGAGADLWSVKGGNKEVPEHLIYRNKYVSVTPYYIKKIRYAPMDDGKQQYELYYGNDDTDLMTSLYDMVIIAAPLTQDQKTTIVFEGFPNDLTFDGEYHTTVATFVKGDVNPQYFGLDESLGAILSCDPEKTLINSIGRLKPVSDQIEAKSRIWKIFSGEVLKTETLYKMFMQIDEVKKIAWKAYPEYSTKIRYDKFKLHDGLYHVNAIEWAASAMEMSVIGSKNVALLAYNEYSKQCISSFNKKVTEHATDKVNTEL